MSSLKDSGFSETRLNMESLEDGEGGTELCNNAEA